MDTKHDLTRRGLLKKAAYAAPVIFDSSGDFGSGKVRIGEKESLEHTPKPKKAKKAKKAKKT